MVLCPEEESTRLGGRYQIGHLGIPSKVDMIESDQTAVT